MATTVFIVDIGQRLCTPGHHSCPKCILILPTVAEAMPMFQTRSAVTHAATAHASRADVTTEGEENRRNTRFLTRLRIWGSGVRILVSRLLPRLLLLAGRWRTRDRFYPGH